MAKTVWQALLFILSTDVGHTEVPHQRGHLRVLDFRYMESDVIKFGEIQEVQVALREYENKRFEFEETDFDELTEEDKEEQKLTLDELGLMALAELSDLFYNWAQLRMGLDQDERASYDFSLFIDHLEGHERKQIEDLIIILTSLAVWKFHYRYFELGQKMPEAEGEYLLIKLKDIDLSPHKLLENNWPLILDLVDKILDVSYEKIKDLAAKEKIDNILLKRIMKKIIKPNNGFGLH